MWGGVFSKNVHNHNFSNCFNNGALVTTTLETSLNSVSLEDS